jgi:hypothetical protein
MTYEEAISTLYRAPHGEFVAERKRLSAELTKAGDKTSAGVLAKHNRPSVSAWAVNQLWWRDQAAMKALFASGARVRDGDLAAAAGHRQATANLVTKAAAILEEAGHSASEATLRKVSANLAALAAAGGFAPDPPGALRSDRDPPGFEVWAAATAGGHLTAGAAAPKADDAKERARAAAAETARRAAEARERARAERARLIAALAEAKTKVEELTRKRDEQKSALTATEAELERVKARAINLQSEVSALTDEE